VGAGAHILLAATFVQQRAKTPVIRMMGMLYAAARLGRRRLILS